MWLTLPFYDFSVFRSVAVNSVYKLQFLLHISLTVTHHAKSKADVNVTDVEALATDSEETRVGSPCCK